MIKEFDVGFARAGIKLVSTNFKEIIEAYNKSSKQIQENQYSLKNIDFLENINNIKPQELNIIKSKIDNYNYWVSIIVYEIVDNIMSARIYRRTKYMHTRKKIPPYYFDIFKSTYSFFRYNKSLLTHFMIFPEEEDDFLNKANSKLENILEGFNLTSYYSLYQSPLGFWKTTINNCFNIDYLNFKFKYRADTDKVSVKPDLYESKTKYISDSINTKEELNKLLIKSILINKKAIAQKFPDLLLKLKAKGIL